MSSVGAPNSKTDPARILLVDDEVRNLDALEDLLDSAECSVVRALNAEAALRALLDHDFAVILMDVHMPGIDGFELAALIKQRPRSERIPIIFLTARSLDQADVLRGYEAGAVDYLTKPVDSKILKTKIAVFVDLFKKRHELVRAEESLRVANAELEARVLERTDKLTAALRAKDDFLAALSHELRTPLNPVLLLASDAAQDLTLPAEVRSRFATIRANVELEARLIDDLLDITRFSHGKLSLNLETIEVIAVLQAAIETVQAEFVQKKIGLTLQLDENGARMKADAMRLQQIFWNIIKNAVKFTPAGGQVTITTKIFRDLDQLQICISDTGIGLTVQEISSIFNAFSQGEHAANGDSHRFGGLGLGLSISQKLVQLHSGSLQASSRGRGQGSAFTIELPILSCAEETATRLNASLVGEAQDVSSIEPESLGIRILLVEDHEPTRIALTQLLSRRKHEVLPAISLNEARTIASQERLDLVISDIGLPDGDGYALMAELRKNFGLKGIALTGYGMEQDVLRGKKAGFLGHLVKPIRMDRLDEMLRSVQKS
jgi:signal transduction histidine kinase